LFVRNSRGIILEAMWSVACIETLPQTTNSGQSKHEPPGKGVEESREIESKSALRSLTERQVSAFLRALYVLRPTKGPLHFYCRASRWISSCPNIIKSCWTNNLLYIGPAKRIVSRHMEGLRPTGGLRNRGMATQRGH
jgi:hypothetical protein